MDGTVIDYAAVFQALPGMVALLTPDLVVADANVEFLRGAGRSREQVVGRYLFEVFPENPHDPAATGMRNLEASLRRAVTTGERDAMALQRYDVENPERPGEWDERYWSPVNTPVLGPDGSVVLVVHRVEEVTELIRARGRRDTSRVGSRARVLEAELYTRARELQQLNERLRQAHAREREVALALQEAMLPARPQVKYRQVAVRYRPAVGALNVCGDWYDLVDLVGGNRIGVSVGDVVGHGLEAAGVMGQLRSALSAASRVAGGRPRRWTCSGATPTSWTAPSRPPRSPRSSTSTTAGSPTPARATPPVLVHRDGRVEFLDRATDPPLDARPEPTQRPQAGTRYGAGATLALYTDGLVERRHEDIDTGLTRLAESLARHRDEDPEFLADAVLLELLPPGGATDDTALVIVRL